MKWNFMNDISAPVRDPRELPHPFSPGRDSRKMAVYEPDSRLPPDTEFTVP